MPTYRAPRNGERNRFLIRVHVGGKPTAKIFRGTRKEAESEEARLLLEVQEAAAHAALAHAVVPSFVAFLTKEYAPSAKLRLRPTWFRNQYYILLGLGEFFDGRTLDEVNTVAHVEAYAAARIEADISPTTVNNEMRVLRRVLSVAKSRGYLETVMKIQFLQEPHRTVDVWSQEQLAALLGAVAEVSPHLLGIVTFLANTGCRRGESLALKWENVDMERGLVRIWPSEEWRPKSGRPREIPISDALLPWLQLPRRSAYVFPTYHGAGKGGRYASWPSLAFDRAVESAKLSGTPHTLRHTFAAHFLASVPDLTLLAELLGHSDTAVTRLYKHLLPDHLARARNAVQVVAPAAAADALALIRWRLERKSSPGPSPVAKSGKTKKAKIPSDFSGAGYRDRTGDIKLGNMEPQLKIVKLLPTDRAGTRGNRGSRG